ncbi:bifunctional DNA primase/polymerase [Deinococcus yunweiensis]|uniref:bifunctional DNA primase/polymerase n=1 Tax=Deinococcus yunweiensis TaxID=367282 RepID=UPI00398F0BC9
MTSQPPRGEEGPIPDDATRPEGTASPADGLRQVADAGLELALALRATGHSVIPVQTDKRPVNQWKVWQTEVASEAQVREWASDRRTAGFGVVCGSVSGGLEVLDFDDAATFELFRAALPTWTETIPFAIQRTGGGGYHVVYKRPHPGRNVKLAWAEESQADGDSHARPIRRLLVETRGEGGYAVLPHSLHPSGTRYEIVAGSMTAIPHVTDEQAETLLALARTFDRSRQISRAAVPWIRGAGGDGRRTYVLKGFEYEISRLAGAAEGERNDVLFRAAAAAGNLAKAYYVARDGTSTPVRVLNERGACERLTAVALQAGLTPKETYATIVSGFRTGRQQPRDVTDKGRQSRTSHLEVGIQDTSSGDLSADHLPEIELSARHLRDVATDSLGALTCRNWTGPVPDLYMRGGKVTRVTRVAGQSTAEAVTRAMLRHELSVKANFVRTQPSKAGAISLPAVPPDWIADELLAWRAEHLPFPELRLIATTPVYTADGELLATAGYHPSGILLELHGVELPDRPSVQQAIQLLRDELLVDFPFVDAESGFPHTLAVLLLPLVRMMIPGPTPLGLVSAPVHGTGKGLLVEVISMITIGQSAPVGIRTSEAELEKRITAKLLAGERIIVLDNVDRLGGQTLAAALTAQIWSSRRLGSSESLLLPNDALWLATGNNPTLDDEMPRRILPIRLDAGLERPADRVGFVHADLRSWVRANRPALLAALIALVDHWITAGRPVPTLTPALGGFESWRAVIGGILETAGIHGLLQNRRYLFEQTQDGDAGEWGQALQQVYAMRRAPGGEPDSTAWLTAKEFLVHLKDLELCTDLWVGVQDGAAVKRTGRALAGIRDRVMNGYCIKVQRDAHRKIMIYRIERMPEHR